MESRATSSSSNSSRRRTGSRLSGPAVVTLAVLFGLASWATGGELFRERGRRVLTARGRDLESGVIALPDSLIVAGSDTLLLSGRPVLRDIDYALDLTRGVLQLFEQPADTVALELTYLYLPGVSRRAHRYADLDTAGELPPIFAGADSLVGLRVPRSDGRRTDADLRVGGAKTFGVSVGSDRDLKLEQSLRLRVDGSVSRDVEVRAYLSDQNTPLVPEGDTEELRSIDEILVEIEAPHASASMGDVRLDLSSGSLVTMRREIQGVRASAERGPFHAVLAGAQVGGEQMSIAFIGIEGKQGPYLLAGPSGEIGVDIVAGSERVWLDGELLKRGSDNDYVIDYGSGELEFTENRPISAESRIEVDYEHAAGDFERNLYGGRIEAASEDERYTVGLTYFRESDDESAPTGATLSDDDVALLALAGDDIDLAHDDGVDSVGYGNGDYVRMPDGTFEYAGPDSGAFDLDFERFDGGDYVYDYFDGRYEYVGAGEGTHRLGRQLPLPSDESIVALDGAVRFRGGGFVETEGALSVHDENTLSPLDDEDNMGNAAIVRFETPALTGGPLGSSMLRVTGSGRRVGGAFRGNGRFRETGYEDQWELTSLKLPDQELTGQGGVGLDLPGGGSVDASIGGLERGDAVRSSRARVELDVSPFRRARLWARGRAVDLSYSTADTARERRRRLVRAGADVTVASLRSGVQWTRDEATENGVGERFDEFGVSLTTVGIEDLAVRASYAYRLTDRRVGTDGWSSASVRSVQDYALEFTRWDGLTADLRVVRRRTEVESGLSEPGVRADLARARLGHSSFGGALRGDVNYSLTTTEVEERERYVTEEDGVEVTRIVSTGRYLPVTELTAGTRWVLRPSAGGARSSRLPDPSALKRWMTRLTLETDVKLREATTTTERTRLYLLDPAVLRGEDTVSGRLTSRHTLRYTSPGGGLVGRLAARTDDELDRIYVNSPETRREREVTLELKLAGSGGLSYRLQADAGRRRRVSEGAIESYDIDARSMLGEIAYRGSGALELRLSGVLGTEEDGESGVTAEVWKLTPAATWRIAGRGSVTASATRLGVSATGGVLPSSMAEGRAPGDAADWRLSADYRFNRYVTGSLSYTGESRPGIDDRHTVDVRVNAFF